MTRQLIPKRFSTKMVWSEKTDTVTAVNTPSFILYAINGMNDPNKTSGSTHQTMGYDQMAVLYNNYVVTGVKVIFEGAPTAAGAHSISIQCGTQGSSFATDPSAINEYRQGYSLITSNQRPWRMSKYFSIASVLGVKPGTIVDNADYWGITSSASNPTFGAELYWQIYNLDASEQINTQWTVTFVYYVTFFNPVPIAQS